MRVLFLHRDFPGPFRHLAASFGLRPDATTLFLSEHGRREQRLPGVRRLRAAPPAPPCTQDEGERNIVLTLRRAAKAANAMLRLRKDGFSPDIVYGAASDGQAFYVRDIFPDALFAVQADWFYTQGENHTFFTRGEPRPPADFAPARVRNVCQYNALGDCDLAVTSSQWQKSQYPDFLAGRIVVEHEGVDAAFFSPLPGARFVAEGCDLTGAPELATFTFRGAGPSRGLPQFLAALPRILALRPRCHALLMATGPADGASSLPDELSAWKNGGSLPPAAKKRVHTLNFRSPAEYRAMLRASSAHVYLTAPFTLSAGLLEAMSCGAVVVGSDTAPVREIVRHGENGFLCDFWDVDQLAATVAGVLERTPRLTPIREAARRTILTSYDLVTQTARHQALLLDALAAKRAV